MKNKVLSVDLRPKQLDAIIGQDDVVKIVRTQFESGRMPHFFLITGPTGSGKCLGYNTPVMMYSGKIKMVQDIMIGDQLKGDDNRPRTILSTCKGQEKMYKIKQSNANDYVVNESHILSLKFIDQDPKSVKPSQSTFDYNGVKYKNFETVDISVRDYICLPNKGVLIGYTMHHNPMFPLHAPKYRMGFSDITVEEVGQDYYEQGPEYKDYYGFEIDGNHRFLLGDGTVTHNTTLAKIIAVMLQNADINKIDYSIPWNRYDINEINASDKNGIDDIRDLLETIKYKPLAPSLAKVYIMDEAHQLTTQAQNALLKVTEDTPKQVYIIFCTHSESKILPTLKRRAYILHTHGIDQKAIHELLTLAKKEVGFSKGIEDLEEELVKYNINSPGLILQAAEKYFAGADLVDCIFNTTGTTIETKALCNLISKGDWINALPILKTMNKEDIVVVKICIIGYLKAILLNPKTSSEKAVNISKAILQISSGYKFDDDLPTFLATVCIATDILSKKGVFEEEEKEKPKSVVKKTVAVPKEEEAEKAEVKPVVKKTVRKAVKSTE
jgi:DNA polymerase III delta prime subunit